jgi:superoxide dismutase, Cu-Zn family
MKTRILSLSLLFCFTFVSCNNTAKKEAKEEKTISVKMERNEDMTVATVTTITKKDGKESEEVQTFEGSYEEVKAKVDLLTQNSQAATVEKKRVKKVQFELNPKSDSTAQGKVTLTEEDGQVTLEAHINGLTPGTHAIHIHQTADCSSDDGKSAGGHWNPTFQDHGAWGAETGFHRGDIGNFTADASGHGMVKFTTDLWCLGCGDEVKNLMGKAVIVHQGEDDLTSQPSGAAGARVSCAGLIF